MMSWMHDAVPWKTSWDSVAVEDGDAEGAKYVGMLSPLKDGLKVLVDQWLV